MDCVVGCAGALAPRRLKAQRSRRAVEESPPPDRREARAGRSRGARRCAAAPLSGRTLGAPPPRRREWPAEPGAYEMLFKAGRGAHATVHCARCKAFDEVVAVKKISLDHSWDLSALVREATLMRRLAHPHVLPLHTSFVAGRELWMVTPFLGAGSVRAIVAREHPDVRRRRRRAAAAARQPAPSGAPSRPAERAAGRQGRSAPRARARPAQGVDEVIIASIMLPVLQALDYLHRNGAMHRDIKARAGDNILLSEAGEVRLADLGVAAAKQRDVSLTLNHIAATAAATGGAEAPEALEAPEQAAAEGAVCEGGEGGDGDADGLRQTTFVGTPCWMAPEVMEQAHGYDASADVWSFGITLLELAHGRPPLARKHPLRVLMDTIRGPPPSLDAHPKGRRFSRVRARRAAAGAPAPAACAGAPLSSPPPQLLREVVEACLQKDPALRASTVELLGLRFWRTARDADFLEAHFLAGLAPARSAPTCGPPPGGRVPSSAARLKSAWHFPPLALETQAEGEEGEEEGEGGAAAPAPAAAAAAAAAAAGVDAGGVEVIVALTQRSSSAAGGKDVGAAGAAAARSTQLAAAPASLPAAGMARRRRLLPPLCCWTTLALAGALLAAQRGASALGIPACPPPLLSCGASGCYSPLMSVACVNGQCQPVGLLQTLNLLVGPPAAQGSACPVKYINACGDAGTFCGSGELCTAGTCVPASLIDDNAPLPPPLPRNATALEVCSAARAASPPCAGDASPLALTDCGAIGVAELPGVVCLGSRDFVCAAQSGDESAAATVHSCRGRALVAGALKDAWNSSLDAIWPNRTAGQPLLQPVFEGMAVRGTARPRTAPPRTAQRRRGEPTPPPPPLPLGGQDLVANVSNGLLAPFNISVPARKGGSAQPAGGVGGAPAHASWSFGGSGGGGGGGGGGSSDGFVLVPPPGINAAAAAARRSSLLAGLAAAVATGLAVAAPPAGAPAGKQTPCCAGSGSGGGGMEPSARRAELDVNDEEGLLRLQEEFFAAQASAQPAARVTRISRPPAGGRGGAAAAAAAAAAGGAAGPAPAQQGGAAGAPVDAACAAGGAAAPAAPAAADGALTPGIPGVLSDIRERAVPAGPPAAPSAAAAAAFPAAEHRKQSKFALGRRRAAEQQQAAPPAPPAGGGAAAAAAAAHGATPPPPAAPLAAVEGRAEAAGIHEGNLERLADMAPEEVEEARSELAGRFSPAALAFLKARGAKRGAAPGGGDAPQQQQGAGGERRQGAGAAEGAAVAAGGRAAAGQAPAPAPAAPGMRRGFLGGTRQQQRPGRAAALAEGRQPGAAAAAGAAAAQSPPPPPPPAAAGAAPPVARLRFSPDGAVLELSADGAAGGAAPDEGVLLRDSLSRAAGAVPDGYTLPELRLLLRSAHPPQRAAGFRLLAVVLRRARAGLGCGGGAAGEVRVEAGGPPGGAPPGATGVAWAQVWEYAVVVLRAALLCRLGLDDDNAGVLSAAADAAAVLLGPAPGEALAEEVAAATPGLGWPRSWRASLRRLERGGVWEQVAGLVAAAAAAQGGEQEEASPEDLAALDPLAGFLGTDPLPRLRHIMQHRSDTEAVGPLLLVLEGVAGSSREAAEAVVRCRGLPEALLQLLDLPLGQGQQGGAAAPAAGSARGSGAARAAVLRLLRLLAAASPLACQLLRTAGLDTAVQLLLCSGGGSGGGGGGGGGGGEEAQLLLLEALRVWRVAATHGVCLAHMEVMFQFVAELLQPPEAPGADGPEADAPRGGDAALRWALAAEAYALVDCLLRHALAVSRGARALGGEMISPGCAAAVAQEAAARWLAAPGALAAAGAALVARADGALQARAEPAARAFAGGGDDAAGEAARLRVTAGLHPALRAPPAFGVVAAHAAVLAFLASYWCSLQAAPRQMAADALQQLHAAGLAGDGGGDGASDLARVLLTAPGGAARQRELGQALLAHCLGLLAAASGGSGDPAEGGDAALAAHCLAAPAATLLLGVCELQRQLTQLCAQQQPQPQCTSAEQQPGLAGRVAGVAAGNALVWLAAAGGAGGGAGGGALAMEPWRLAQLATQQYQLRLLIRLARPLLPALAQGQQQQGQRGAGTAEGALLWRLVDGLLCVPALSAPGQEVQALQALQLVLGPGAPAGGAGGVPGQLLAAARGAVQELRARGGPLAAAAAGLRADTLPAAAADGAGGAERACPHWPAVLDPSGVDLAAWCRVLLDGYAVAWLSVVAQPAEQLEQQRTEQQQDAASRPPAELPLPRALVAESEGSRLPAPPEWLLAEVLALPRQQDGGDVGGALHPAAAAALLALGLEAQADSSYMSAAAGPGAKLEALLQLLYLGKPGQLLPPRQQAALGPGWQAADARWVGAVLSERYAAAAVAAGGGAPAAAPATAAALLKAECPVQQAPEAQGQQQLQPPPQPAQRGGLFPSWAAAAAGGQLVDRLVRELGEVSTGDALFAAHAALLLLPAAGAALRRGAWASLADHAALHLPPPPRRCILGADPYLGLPPAGGPGGAGAAAFDVQLVGDMAKALAQGDLRKSLQMGGLAGELALHGVAALALDQRAWAGEPSAAAASATGGGEARPAAAAAMAVNVLRGVLRACEPALLLRLLAAGRARGLPLAEQARAVVQAAHGDAALMAKAQQLLLAAEAAEA
ncbi:Oxsr1 [Scenedesmus sp. PABB004]|nr:Oxsr1 [Scenedesmus sp. PABB004]